MSVCQFELTPDQYPTGAPKFAHFLVAKHPPEVYKAAPERYASERLDRKEQNPTAAIITSWGLNDYPVVTKNYSI